MKGTLEVWRTFLLILIGSCFPLLGAAKTAEATKAKVANNETRMLIWGGLNEGEKEEGKSIRVKEGRRIGYQKVEKNNPIPWSFYTIFLFI